MATNNAMLWVKAQKQKGRAMSTAVTSTKKARRDHPWDQARRLLLKRRNELSDELQPLDRGVNYFVLQFERMGIRTEWSCEGHPAGFYITFHATYEQALRIKSHGYFTVEVEGLYYWSMRFSRPHNSTRERNFSLRLAAAAWEQAFGPLDQEMARGSRS